MFKIFLHFARYRARPWEAYKAPESITLQGTDALGFDNKFSGEKILRV
jgi:hypothetical protein